MSPASETNVLSLTELYGNPPDRAAGPPGSRRYS